jgi:UDPglucose--hexose-1-phosphate uridylyltransferase
VTAATDRRNATTVPHDPPHDVHPPRLHHDGLGSRTVFIAPRRALRPTFTAGAGTECPFCAGNETMTPPAVMRFPDAAETPWHVRIIPNQFPVVEHAPGRAAAAAFERPAHGVHEVVVESAAHDCTILALDPSRWRDVWELCRRRLATLAERDDLAWATVFKNSGPAAGSSVDHVHSQLIALDFVPPVVRSELAAAGDDADAFGDLIRRAAAEGRIVAEAGDLVALVPPAPRQAFETWILPRAAEPHFHAASRDHADALADLTRLVIGRLDRLAPGADYNWWLHQAPFDRRTAPSRWHWHLEILPRLSGLAGFELGTGCHITTAGAEVSARRLRDA